MKIRRLPLLMLTLIEVLRPPESKKAFLRHASCSLQMRLYSNDDNREVPSEWSTS